MYLHLHVWIDSILITHTSRAIRKEKALPGKTQASAGKFRGKDAEIVGLRASVDAKVQAAVKETFAQVAAALECACCLEPLAPGAAVALECGHTLQPRGVRLLVGRGVHRVSATDRRARAALWGACQRVRAAAARGMTLWRRRRCTCSLRSNKSLLLLLLLRNVVWRVSSPTPG